MQHLMTEQIAINAKMTAASSALIPLALTRQLLFYLFFSIFHPLVSLAFAAMPRFDRICGIARLLVSDYPELFIWRRVGKWQQAAHALSAANLLCALPADLDPIAKWEEMVVAPCQMRRQY